MRSDAPLSSKGDLASEIEALLVNGFSAGQSVHLIRLKYSWRQRLAAESEAQAAFRRRLEYARWRYLGGSIKQ